MTSKDLINNLIEFYQQCSNRGWCKVKASAKAEIVTIYSSETNFMHLPPIYGRLPESCIISPKLAIKNVKILQTILTEFDSLRIVTVTPYKFWYTIRIVDYYGRVLKHIRLKRYTVRWWR